MKTENNPEKEDTRDRSVRGGCWDELKAFMNCRYRDSEYKDASLDVIGLRMILKK